MTRDDIIRMAREAGYGDALSMLHSNALERFAALVAAAERERLKWDGLHSCHPECDRPACVHTRKAVEAEREACAKIGEFYVTASNTKNEPGIALIIKDYIRNIRARGQG